jgi:phage-related protein
MKPTEKLHAIFYRSGAGVEPVRDWLKGLDATQRKAIGEDIRTAQYGWPIGMPLIRKLETGLWEVRTKFRNGIARTVFTVNGNQMVLLHSFIKKTQKTPPNELRTARQRLKKYQEES